MKKKLDLKNKNHKEEVELAEIIDDIVTSTERLLSLEEKIINLKKDK